MLACQFIAWVLASVKRFDSIVLHAWESVREIAESLRTGREAGLAE
jgi:hypothetical protein